MKLIFSLTAGRTGSKFLATLIRSNIPEARVYHEILTYDAYGKHTPDISIMHHYNNRGNTPEVQAFWKQKLNRILLKNNQYYAETSHILSKAGLVDNAVTFLTNHELHFVIQTRDMVDTLLSYHHRSDFLNVGNLWLWYLDPGYSRNLVKYKTFENLGVPGLRLWYLIEMGVRNEYYRLKYENYPGVHFHKIDLYDLNNPKAASSLLKAFKPDFNELLLILPSKQNQSVKKQISNVETEQAIQLVKAVENIDYTAIAKNILDSGINPFIATNLTPGIELHA